MENMNATPMANRFAIGLFGRRNAGKSSLINALTGQNVAVTSEVPGTTTDPVYKAMELLPIGPIVLIDTAGLDDTGGLGALRIEKTYEVSADTPPEVPMTSFSILFARQKADLAEMVRGVRRIETLSPGDKVLIAEGCTHHRQSDDIGRHRQGKDPALDPPDHGRRRCV